MRAVERVEEKNESSAVTLVCHARINKSSHAMCFTMAKRYCTCSRQTNADHAMQGRCRLNTMFVLDL